MRVRAGMCWYLWVCVGMYGCVGAWVDGGATGVDVGGRGWADGGWAGG